MAFVSLILALHYMGMLKPQIDVNFCDYHIIHHDSEDIRIPFWVSEARTGLTSPKNTGT